jgi:hypothetical protein
VGSGCAALVNRAAEIAQVVPLPDPDAIVAQNVVRRDDVEEEDESCGEFSFRIG